ncbi:AmmeMemoRadiSam system radical SAM enzyme [Halodesulfovibrio marinisediminis]|uniref:Pyruvate formate lyase activating enzyme n=1 Tax=Halodesulfovibrio marinisediminis DSM 17456 TaxID=1121457 RepID=A0A1N6DTP0_9BACT|nr:AmmeMemoRadiSam system radical SAM enzyme [Halodesulfovibrio marinisediminis]SIN74168.1 pyruvate formate lyase activating enzyme [Halodesulfovibrio marinisediminis DSM 17456]
MHPARLWKTLGKSDGTTPVNVQCRLCSHFCNIAPDTTGKCGVRKNVDGKLYTLVFDKVAAANLDPIEKKPLYHFLPGTTSFSFGTVGCNLTCSFCQNYTLSTTPRLTGQILGQHTKPERLVELALESGAQSISYTYSEPTIFFELVEATAKLAIKHGLKNILVSNGFQSPECLAELKDLIHACNIDLKGATESFYSDICGAHIRPVLRNLKIIREMDWWLEVTTLVIPDENDDEKELSTIARFINDELGSDTPWHISRFHPAYKMQNRIPTPIETLRKAAAIGKEAGLNYVYLGNIPGREGRDTLCPKCGAIVIERKGYSAARGDYSKCPTCDTPIPGVWSIHDSR